jgi:hypothetical protein
MFTCALTTGTDVPLTQNKTAKSNISFFFITFLFSDESPGDSKPENKAASPLLEIAWVFLHLHHVYCFIVNANHSVM